MEEKRMYRPSPTALLDPWRDSIFKKIFTDQSPQGNKALQSFLEAVLGRSVSDIVLLPTELPIESTLDKQARFDLYCKIDNSEYANIEIQGIDTEKAFEKRAEYYCAHLLNHNVQKGLGWQEIPKVYQISVLKFIREKETSKELFHYKFRTEEGYSLHDRQNIFFLELPKVEKLVEKIKNGKVKVESLTDTQKWSIFILYASKEEYRSLIKENSSSQEGIMCAVRVLYEISQDEVMWKRQFDELMIENDRITLERFYREKGLEIGLQQGIQQGIQQGKEQGIQQGIQQGLEEGIQQGLEEGMNRKTHEIAKNLKSMGLSNQDISKVTNLTIEEIIEL